MSFNIGLNDKQRTGVIALLNSLLADEYILYTKTRNYHWNVVGPQFHDFHKFFEAQYTQLDEFIDQVAERARSLGGLALGSLAEFAANTRLKEQPARLLDAQDMAENLLADHETIIRELRQDLEAAATKFNDVGTQDFLTGLMEQHEKMAWMLRSIRETSQSRDQRSKSASA